ncbi:MAG: 30S ribosomal protein S21 [Fidelibacterota bacterium]
MIQVKVRPNEPIERALKRFKKKFEKSGILKDYKKNEYFIKPTEERRIRKAQSVKRVRKQSRMKNM